MVKSQVAEGLLRGCRGLTGGGARKVGANSGEWGKNVGKNPEENSLKYGLGILLVGYSDKQIIRN